MQCPKQLRFRAAWLFGCLVGLLLLVQSIAGYFCVPRGLQSDRPFGEAGHRSNRLERTAHRRVRPDASDIARLMKELFEEELQQPVAWLRVLGPRGGVLVPASKPTRSPASRDDLRRLLLEPARMGHGHATPQGKVFVSVVPPHIPVRSPEPPSVRSGPRSSRLLEIALCEENALRGGAPVACVVLNDGGTIDPGRASATIRRTGRHRLADFKQPRDVLVLPNFPRAELGKIAKNQLKDLVGSSSGVSQGRRRCRTRVLGQENSLL